MKRFTPVFAALALAGCVATPAVVAPAPLPPQKSAYVQELEKFRAEVVERRRINPDDDKPVRLMQNCRSLFAPGTDAERLCLLRGIDRYVDHDTVPRSERYLRQDDTIVVPVPKPVPPAPAAVPPRDPSALVWCSVDPTPPCYIPYSPQANPGPP